MGKILIACEYSAIVRDAFRANGHDAWSCDIEPSEGDQDWHIKGDVLKILNRGWDMMIAHPPCTYLTLAGARWFYDDRYPTRRIDQANAIQFFKKLQSAPCKYIAIENPQPLGIVTAAIGPYDQKIQPWQFGDNETKGICLWLKNMPQLRPFVVKKPATVEARVWRMAPGPKRQKERSRFFRGVARAMADQWGRLV